MTEKFIFRRQGGAQFRQYWLKWDTCFTLKCYSTKP